MQYSRFASESDVSPQTAEELSRVYPHSTHRHQTSLPNLHDPHPVPTFAPYPYSLVPKEEMRQQYVPPPAGLEDHDFRIGESYARGGGGDRSNPMVLSNPVPDYSVASGSSPFTLQPQAPHFQPRPRPVMNSYPLPRHDFDQQPQLPDPQQIPHLLPHQLPHQQMHHPLPHQHHQLHPDPRHIPYTTEWDFPGLPMRNGHDARLSEILSQPTPPLPYSNVPHLPMHDPYRSMGSRNSPLLQHQPIDQLPPNAQAAAAYTADSYVQPISEDEQPSVNGKKPRKRRRLKGELPRDHALRKYQCLSCPQKFARPSSVVFSLSLRHYDLADVAVLLVLWLRILYDYRFYAPPVVYGR